MKALRVVRFVAGVALACGAVALGTGGCAPAGGATPPTTVPQVDLNRYAGLWYEIAKYPVVFENNCFGVTATYTLQPNGTVQVFNTCQKGSLNGPSNDITGTARAVDSTNAKLKVSFFGPLFEADYWIIELDPNYQWAVVSDPNRRTLWILSRTPSMDPATYQSILQLITAQGYDINRLELMPQA